MDSTGAVRVNWSSLTVTAKTREPRRSHSYYDLFFDADKEAGYETEEQQATGSSRPEPIDSSQQTERSELRVPEWWVELPVLRPELDRSVCSLPVRQHNPPVGQPSPRAWQFNQLEPRRKLAFSTKHGRRQHQQDLRRAQANRKIAKGGAPQFTQGVLQTRSAFAFGLPSTPVTAVMATRGLFVFGLGSPSMLAHVSKKIRKANKNPENSRKAKENPFGPWPSLPSAV
jgi:hypothetical protein